MDDERYTWILGFHRKGNLYEKEIQLFEGSL